MKTLQESLFSSYLAWYSIKLLSRPFSKWKAFDEGIIDENGNVIKQPRTVEEGKAWGMFEKFIANIKRTIIRVVGPSQASAILTTLALFKENSSQVAYDMLYAEVCKKVGYDIITEAAKNEKVKMKFKSIFNEKEK